MYIGYTIGFHDGECEWGEYLHYGAVEEEAVANWTERDSPF